MFKISRLYIKLYLYIIAIIASLLLLSAIQLLPLKETYYIDINDAVNFIAISGLINSSSSPEELVKHMSEKYKYGMTLYNDRGYSVVSTEKEDVSSIDKIIKEINRKGSYTYVLNDRIYFILPVNNKRAYLQFSLENQFTFKELAIGFIKDLLCTSLIMSICLYPLSLYLTKPLEKITETAIKFSKGDFSELNKKNLIKGNDEIAQLNRAFTCMAKELVSMIEEKKDLISYISHELNSPLSKMQIAVEIIKNKLEAGEQPSFKTVGKLSGNIGEMLKMVNELLELSALNKTYILAPEKVNMDSLLTAILEDFHGVLRGKNIIVKTNKEGDIKEISIDKTKIKRVVENLLYNAIEYTPPGSVIEITLRGEGVKNYFSIKDEGPGIKEENKEKIFEPFFREDPSRTRKTGGAGLGLAIVKKIIDLHHGHIWLENPGEKGALIAFRV